MRYILVIFFSALTMAVSAQDESSFAKNELKTNVLNDLLGIVHLNYERLLNDESGVGLHLAAFVGRSIPANLTASPYYRQYFGKKPGAGFFVEGSAVLVTFDNDGNDGGITAGLSLAFGTKLLTKKDVVFEGYLGLSRLFEEGLFDEDGGGSLVYPRVGITVGKRF